MSFWVILPLPSSPKDVTTHKIPLSLFLTCSNGTFCYCCRDSSSFQLSASRFAFAARWGISCNGATNWKVGCYTHKLSPLAQALHFMPSFRVFEKALLSSDILHHSLAHITAKQTNHWMFKLNVWNPGHIHFWGTLYLFGIRSIEAPNTCSRRGPLGQMLTLWIQDVPRSFINQFE